MAGWEHQLDELVRQRRGALVGYASLYARDRRDAEDLVHDALIRTFSRPRTFADAGAAEGYVRTAIRTAFLDQVRKERTWSDRAHLFAREESTRGPEAPTTAGVDVRAALGALSPRQRACVVLRHFDDLTVADIAGVLAHLTGPAADDEVRTLRTAVRRRRAVRWGTSGLSAAAAVAVFAVGVQALTAPEEPTPPATQSPTPEPSPTPTEPSPTPTATPTEEPVEPAPTVTVHDWLPVGATLVDDATWDRVGEGWVLVRHMGFEYGEGPGERTPVVLYLVSPEGELFEVPAELDIEVELLDWDLGAREALLSSWELSDSAEGQEGTQATYVLDLESGALIEVPRAMNAAAFGPDGTILGTTETELLVVERDGTVRARTEHGDREYLDIDPEGSYVAVGGRDTAVRVLRTPDLTSVTLPTIRHERLVGGACTPTEQARFGSPGRLVVTCGVMPDPDSNGVVNYQPALFDVPLEGGEPRLVLRQDLVGMYGVRDVLLDGDTLFVNGEVASFARDSEWAGRTVVAEVAASGEAFGHVTPDVWPYRLGPGGRALVDPSEDGSGSLAWVDLRDGSVTDVLVPRAPYAVNSTVVAGG